MRFLILIFRYCHPTNRMKLQPGRVQPCPTPQPHIHQYLPTFDPRQPGRSIIDLIHNRAQVIVPFPVLLHDINRQDIQVFLSVDTCPDQVESINSWISGICKDYHGIIPLGAMHPERPDPEAEAESMWMRQPGIKLHGPNRVTSDCKSKASTGLEVGL
jgi:hypothetical protein